MTRQREPGQARGVPIDVRRILVPLDFSENTPAVLEWAAHLAEEHGSQVVLLHAYHLPVEFQQLEGAYLPEDFWANVKAETEQSLARYAETQDSLLDIAAQLVGPGGRLVFVTCSLLDAEGANRFAAFLARHPHWRADAPQLPLGQAHGAGIRLTPLHDGTDGFFIALATLP